MTYIEHKKGGDRHVLMGTRNTPPHLPHLDNGGMLCRLALGQHQQFLLHIRQLLGQALIFGCKVWNRKDTATGLAYIEGSPQLGARDMSETHSDCTQQATGKG